MTVGVNHVGGAFGFTMQPNCILVTTGLNYICMGIYLGIALCAAFIYGKHRGVYHETSSKKCKAWFVFLSLVFPIAVVSMWYYYMFTRGMSFLGENNPWLFISGITYLGYAAVSISSYMQFSFCATAYFHLLLPHHTLFLIIIQPFCCVFVCNFVN